MKARVAAWVEIRRLEDRANVPVRVLELAVSAAEDECLAGARRGQPEQQPQQRRFAGAVRSEKSRDRAGLEREAHVVEGDEITEALRQRATADNIAAQRSGVD